jgi:molecular chaperone DnaK (HSP70)
MLSQEQIDKMSSDAERFKIQDENVKKRLEMKK